MIANKFDVLGVVIANKVDVLWWMMRFVAKGGGGWGVNCVRCELQTKLLFFFVLSPKPKHDICKKH